MVIDSSDMAAGNSELAIARYLVSIYMWICLYSWLQA